MQDYWRHALIQKVLNMRKRRDRIIPQVNQRINTRNIVRAKNKNVSAHGLQSYLPAENSLTEDKDSIIKHKQLMFAEINKRSPDNIKIESSMIATFDNRRKAIVMEDITLAGLKNEYPALFDCHQVR